MNTKQIKVDYDINRMSAVDLISVIHIDDCNTRFIELALSDQGSAFPVTGSAVIARFATVKGVLLSDSVSCTVTEDGNILIPIDAAAVNSVACDLKIEVNITQGGDVLTLPFPLWVRVRGSILETSHISPESEGTIPDLLREVERELRLMPGFVEEKAFEILDGTLSGDRSISPTLLADSVTDQTYNPDGDLILYYIDSEDVRHNIFNFSQVLCSNEAATEMIDTALSGDSYGMNMTLNLDNNVDMGANPNGHLMLYYIDSDWTRHNVFDFTPYLENYVSSAVVNQNGTITFTLDDGSTFTTTGSSVIGSDGFSPTVSTTSEYLRTRVEITDVNGTQNIYINDGESVKSAIIDANGDLIITIKGKPTSGVRPTYPERVYNVGHVVGADGSDYILTDQDKSDIADLVLAELPTTQGVQYGNAGN